MAPCVTAHNELARGAAVLCPGGNCGPIPVIYRGRRTVAFFHAYADGYQGYVPVYGAYIGSGYFAPFGSFARNGPPRFEHSSDPFDTNFAQLNGSTGERLLGRIPDWQLHDIVGAEKQAYIRDVRAIVEKPKCKQFLEGLFRVLNRRDRTVAPDILGVFDIVDSQEGILTANPKKLWSPEYNYFSTVSGSTSAGNAALLLNPIGGVRVQDLLTAIHEVLHQAGQYTGDRQMAVAVFQLRKEENLLVTGVNALPGDATDTLANSSWWNKYLDAACNPEFNK